MKSLTTKEENVLEIIKEIDGDFSEVDNDKLKVSICDYILDGNLFIKYNFWHCQKLDGF
jgi:hydroxypyruvate isomerase